jgi:hypothetical protein
MQRAPIGPKCMQVLIDAYMDRDTKRIACKPKEQACSYCETIVLSILSLVVRLTGLDQSLTPAARRRTVASPLSTLLPSSMLCTLAQALLSNAYTTSSSAYPSTTSPLS